MIQEYFCSLLSAQAQESLHATASHGEVWFLLENHGIWEGKAFEQSDIPGALKNHLSAVVRATPGSRVLMIKSGHGRMASGISFFVVHSRETSSAIYEFTVQRYEEILDLDIQAVLDDSELYRPSLRKEPLYLICTNGKRDPCCAKFGMPVYAAMLAQVGSQVWQSSHVGGHRFAANLVCFPHGLYFGRLTPGNVKQVLDRYQQGKIHLEFYRGRACYPEEVQAAEYHRRRETGELGLEAFTFQDFEQQGEDTWLVRFREAASGRQHQLHIQRELSNLELPQSCLKAETSPLVTYHLLQHSST